MHYRSHCYNITITITSTGKVK